MDGLDLLGATDDLANQYITVRVKSIDREKLKLKLGGSTGEIAKGAMSLVDAAPKAVIDILLPIIKGEAKQYGVELETSTATSVPKGKRAVSEFWPGMAVGGVLGVSILGIGKLVRALVGRVAA